MLKTLTEHGEEPLTIVLYQDGVDPGDGLVKDKARHSICFYWTFLEFGMINLCHEELWVAGMIARTRKAKSIHGGVGELTYILMEQFHPDNGNDMLVNGVVVNGVGHHRVHSVWLALHGGAVAHAVGLPIVAAPSPGVLLWGCAWWD